MANSVKCGICKTSFSDTVGIIQHMTVHVQVQQCPDCTEYFPKLSSPVQHSCSTQFNESLGQTIPLCGSSQHAYCDGKNDTECQRHCKTKTDLSNREIWNKSKPETFENNSKFFLNDGNHLQGQIETCIPTSSQSPKNHVVAKLSEGKTFNPMENSETYEDNDETDVNDSYEDGRQQNKDSSVSDASGRRKTTDASDELGTSREETSENSEGTYDTSEPHDRKYIVDKNTRISSQGDDGPRGYLHRKDTNQIQCAESHVSPDNADENVYGDETEVGKAEFRCQICGKNFVSSRARKVHQAAHPGGFVSDCKFCGKHFKNGSNLARHIQMHRGEKPYKCKTCGKRYADHKTVLIHQRVHTGERPHRCEKCGKTFSNPKSYHYHMKQHVGRRIRCNRCGKTFASTANLSVHVKTHGKKDFICDICDKGFFQLGNLKRHQRTHQRDEEAAGTEMVMKLDVRDGICSKSTHIRRKNRNSEVSPDQSETDNFEVNMIQKASPLRQKSLRETNKKKLEAGNTLQCDICEKYFMDYSSMKNHIELHFIPDLGNHEETTDDKILDNVVKRKRETKKKADVGHLLRPYCKGRKLVTCSKEAMIRKESLTSDLFLSEQSENDDGCNDTDGSKEDSDSGVVVSNTSGEQSDRCNSITEPSRKKYKKAAKNKTCDICGKAYSSVKRLTLHRVEHDNPPEPIYTCEKCGKSFNRLSGLSRHRKSHASSKTFPCEFCQKTFTCKSKHEIHTRIHTGERPYKCEDCDKTFAAKSGFHQHRQLHDLGKVQCPVCSKILTNKSYLKRHMRIHTQEKPYKCEICDEAFYMYGTYRNHRLAHQGIPPKVYTKKQPATCEVCGKFFLSKYYLISHMRLHTGEKPFVCDICGRGFVQGHGLRRHLQFHEKEKARPEKKFQCHVCQNFYPDSKNLQRHMIYHNRERNCKCQICGKAYIRPSHLKRHMIDTHKMNPKTPNKNSSLIQHPTVMVSQTSDPSVSTSHPPLPSVAVTFTAPVTAACIAQAQLPVPIDPVPPQTPMAPSAVTHIVHQPQQYQQVPDNLQIHTMEPAMYNYY